MKRAIVLGLVVFASDARGQPPLTAAQVMARVQSNYATGAVAAELVQRYTATAYNTTKTSKARVVIASGGRSDWEYTTPPNNRVVSNTRGVCVYESANNALYVQSAASSPFGPLVLLLSGATAGTFNLSLDSSAMPGGYVVIARPSAPSPTLTSVLLYVDATTFEIRRALLLDSKSNRNVLDFTNIQHNAPIVPGQFFIRPPPNASFIGPNGQTAVPATCP